MDLTKLERMLPSLRMKRQAEVEAAQKTQIQQMVDDAHTKIASIAAAHEAHKVTSNKAQDKENIKQGGDQA